MRRLILALTSALLLSSFTVVPAQAASGVCTNDGDTCIVRVTSAVQQQWLVRLQNLTNGSITTCRVAGDCVFEVPYKAAVQVLVASTLPFTWEDSSKSITGASGWVKGIPMPADVLGPKTGDAAGKLIIDSNVSFAVSAKSPITITSRDDASISISTSLGLLGPAMSSALASAPNQSFADWFGVCAIGSTIVPEGRDKPEGFALVLEIVGAQGTPKFRFLDSSRLTYSAAPADSPFAEDRTITGRLVFPYSNFGKQDFMYFQASIISIVGGCKSGAALGRVARIENLLTPPTIPEQVLPPVTGASYAYQLSAEGIRFKPTWKVLGTNPLPERVKLSETGLLTVESGLIGNYTFSVTVQDGSGAVSEPRRLRITGYLPPTNPDAARDVLLKRGCSAGGERCVAIVQMMSGRAADLTVRERCLNSTLCVGDYRIGDPMNIVAEVSGDYFGWAELTLYPRGGGAPVTRPLSATKLGQLNRWLARYGGLASGDAVVRVYDKSKFTVIPERSAPAVRITGRMSAFRDNMTLASPLAQEPVRDFCTTGFTKLGPTVNLPDGSKPQLIAMLSRSADFAKPFAIRPFQTGGIGLFNDSSYSEWISLAGQQSGRILVAFALLDAYGNVACATSVGQQVSFDYVAPAAPIVLTGLSDSEGQLGTAYRQDVNVAGGTAPYVFELASGELPRGLALETSTGTISGTLAQAGVFPFVVRATDSAGKIGVSNGMSISADWRVLAVLPASLTVGTAVSGLRVSAVQWEEKVDDPAEIRSGTAKILYSVTGLPNGLSIDAATGVVGGVPTEAGEFNAEFTAKLLRGAVVVSQQRVNVQSLVASQAPPVTRVTAVPQPVPANVPTVTSLRQRPAPPDPTLTQVVVPRPVDVAQSGSTDPQAVLESAVTPPTKAVQPPVIAVPSEPGTSTPTAPVEGSATKVLRLTFAKDRATASAAARAAFAAAVKAFGKITSITISSPAVASKNGKPTPTSQSIAFLRTQVVKNQLKAAGATATATSRVVAAKKPSATVTVTLKRS